MSYGNPPGKGTAFLLLLAVVGCTINNLREEKVAYDDASRVFDAHGSVLASAMGDAAADADHPGVFHDLMADDAARLDVMTKGLQLGGEPVMPASPHDPLAPPAYQAPVTTPLDEFLARLVVTPWQHPLGTWLSDGERRGFLLCQIQSGHELQYAVAQPWTLAASLTLLSAGAGGQEPEINVLDTFDATTIAGHEMLPELERLRRGCLLDYLAIYRPEALSPPASAGPQLPEQDRLPEPPTLQLLKISD